jgi:hypothetical protein
VVHVNRVHLLLDCVKGNVGNPLMLEVVLEFLEGEKSIVVIVDFLENSTHLPHLILREISRDVSSHYLLQLV